MREEHGGCVMAQGRLHHFPGMGFGVVYRAGKQCFVREQTMLVVEQQHHKHFTLQGCQLQT
ncbi:hypothetical protein D3C85_1736050 [compost metagenome]